MPYSDEQWNYFSDWKNYSKEKDMKYSEQEFDYFIGVQSYTYKPAEKDRPENEFITQRNAVVGLGNLPRERYTCSRVFCNFYQRCRKDLIAELLKREVYLVCSQDANISNLGLNIKKVWKVSRKNAWKHDVDVYDQIQEQMSRTKHSVLLCCAGFFGNIAISKLCFDHNFNINIGSVFDPILLGRTTRPYQRQAI